MVCLGVCAALGPCMVALCLWLCVHLRCTHSLVVRRPKHDSLTATLRLWKQREIDLECERGEVKVLYTEGWVGLKLQTGGWPCFHSMDETKQRQTGLNRWVCFPRVATYCISQLFKMFSMLSILFPYYGKGNPLMTIFTKHCWVSPVTIWFPQPFTNHNLSLFWLCQRVKCNLLQLGSYFCGFGFSFDQL